MTLIASNGLRRALAGLILAALGPILGSGCGGAAERELDASPGAPKPVVVTTAEAVRRPVERAIEVVGTLHGWEEVTLGSKQTGRVVAVRHDVGDRVSPEEPLVDLDPVDARLAVDEARSRLLGELVRLGITADQAEEFTSRYGVSEELLANEEVNRIILEIPAIQQAGATLDQATTRLNRQRQLSQRNAGTQQELQDAESEERIAQAARENAVMTARTVIADALSSHVALQQAQEALREMQIVAPRPSALPPGVDSPEEVRYAISRRQVSEGQFLRPGDPVIDLVLEHPLRLRVSVPERFVAEVSQGQEVGLRTAAFPDRIFRGSVARINPSVDPVSRTFEVEAEVPNPDLTLHPGSFAKARIITVRESEATLVPIEAIVRFAGVVKLFLLETGPDGYQARELAIETGAERDGLVEVLGGLPEDAVVITSGQTRLADRTPVVIRPGLAEDESPEAEEPAVGAEGEASDEDG
ncbi:efflux RND transporter periplasmic adaptor subunit [Tautonia plasticadhaerens]|uniref:Multidrug resistance protein MdtA n=1 Tax=Tautonia plasticadhaerens TaxID=2527974 RepID=A0A518GY68_9BACT|nr:efflux RND transporter periplasmic adaptor subunit [Tautonia plasticadhaerens]QDV33525.1 Multidrug resistance protein MdtA precursor [Tautonia plasticadhaerens]